MHFRFVRFQHGDAGRDSLEDLVALIAGQMFALGHTVECDPEAALKEGANYFYTGPGVVNVVFEAFNDATVRQTIATVVRKGAVIANVCTEDPSPQGFNHGFTPAAAARQAAMIAIAPHMAANWVLPTGTGALEWYARLGAPAAQLGLAAVPSLKAHIAAADPDPVKEYDFGWFGSVSPRRDLVLHELVLRTHARVRRLRATDKELVPWDKRNAAMRSCHAGLALRVYDNSRVFSTARAAMLLHMDLPVVGDRHDDAGVWHRIVDLAPRDDAFLQLACQVRNAAAATASQQWAAYEQILTPQACLGRVLEETLGIKSAEQPVVQPPAHQSQPSDLAEEQARLEVLAIEQDAALEVLRQQTELQDLVAKIARTAPCELTTGDLR